MDHHLSYSKPHLNFLTEIRLSKATDSSSYSVPSYFLYSHFRSIIGCCVYVCCRALLCSHAHALESSGVSTIWLKLTCHSTIKFFCGVYRSPNSSHFQYLTSKLEHILTKIPFAKSSINGDFNVCHQLWLSMTNLMNKPSTLLSFII